LIYRARYSPGLPPEPQSKQQQKIDNIRALCVSPGRKSMSVQHEAFAEANVLKECAAASYIGVSLSTLRRRRAARRRPAFIQIDRSIGYSHHV
jgi:hypothetical protein